jgi:hypothetical protein
MQGNEAMYGYLCAAELIVVSVLNLTVTHGSGAPTHADTTSSLIGLGAAVVFGGLVRTHNRFIGAFAAIISASFVTRPKVPSSLVLTHLFALVIPVVYAFLLTQRQRKAAMAQAKASRAAARAEDRRTAGSGGWRRRKKEPEAPLGPVANRRYTPPKSKLPPAKAKSRRSTR